MSKATLTYVINKGTNNDNSVLYLESGSLRYVDYCTKRFKDENMLIGSPLYYSRIVEFRNRVGATNDGELLVSYIEDSDRREILPILFDEEKEIVTTLGISAHETNEIENARHLLWTSKDDRYLKAFLDDKRFAETTFYNIKLTSNKEYQAAFEAGFKPELIGSDNYLSIEEILNYKLQNSSKKAMRSLIEDALEVWKEKIYELDHDQLYYYARNLRLIEKKYNKYLKEKKAVVHLDIASQNLYNAVDNGVKLIEVPVSGRHTYRARSKQKILADDRKAA